MLTRHAKTIMVFTRAMSRQQTSNTVHYPFEDVPNEQMFKMQIESTHGLVKYNKQGNVYDLQHTEIPKSLQGKGLGKIIAQKTLDHIAQSNGRMILTCDFLISYYEANKTKYQPYVIQQ